MVMSADIENVINMWNMLNYLDTDLKIRVTWQDGCSLELRTIISSIHHLSQSFCTIDLSKKFIYL